MRIVQHVNGMHTQAFHLKDRRSWEFVPCLLDSVDF